MLDHISFFWSTDPVGHTNNPDTVSLLAEGSYYVTTQDALGCEVLDSIYVSEPEPLTMQATALSWISCFGADDGIITPSATGGTTPYLFSNDGGNNYFTSGKESQQNSDHSGFGIIENGQFCVEL